MRREYEPSSTNNDHEKERRMYSITIHTPYVYCTFDEKKRLSALSMHDIMDIWTTTLPSSYAHGVCTARLTRMAAGCVHS
jgi:hypothetical protein